MKVVHVLSIDVCTGMRDNFDKVMFQTKGIKTDLVFIVKMWAHERAGLLEGCLKCFKFVFFLLHILSACFPCCRNGAMHQFLSKEEEIVCMIYLKFISA